MALYDFICDSGPCGNFEMLLPMSKRNTARVKCPTCGRRAKRIEVPNKAPTVVMMRRLETSDKQIPDRMLP